MSASAILRTTSDPPPRFAIYYHAMSAKLYALFLLTVTAAVANIPFGQVQGDLSVTGSARITADSLAFSPLFTIQPLGTTKSFLTLIGGHASSSNLDPFALPAVSFSADPTLNLRVQAIQSLLPPLTPCPNANPCALNQFTLTQHILGSTLSFDVLGFVQQNGINTGSFIGTFNFALLGGNADILNSLTSPGFLDAPFSAQFRVTSGTIPEPAESVALAAAAGITLLIAFRSRCR